MSGQRVVVVTGAGTHTHTAARPPCACSPRPGTRSARSTGSTSRRASPTGSPTPSATWRTERRSRPRIQACSGARRPDRRLCLIRRRRAVRTLRDDHGRRVGPRPRRGPNAKGPFMVMQAAMPLDQCLLRARSSTSRRSPVGCRSLYTTAYAAAKGGLTMLTRALALALFARGHPGQRHLPRHRRHADRRGGGRTGSPTTLTPASRTG